MGVNIDKSDVVAEKRMEVQVKEQETDKVVEILGDEENSESDIADDTKKAVIKNEDDYQEPKVKPFASEDDDSDEKMKSTTPEMAGASIVKYNVKTTPYLQKWVLGNLMVCTKTHTHVRSSSIHLVFLSFRVKKIIECKTAPGSGLRRKKRHQRPQVSDACAAIDTNPT